MNKNLLIVVNNKSGCGNSFEILNNYFLPKLVNNIHTILNPDNLSELEDNLNCYLEELKDGRYFAIIVIGGDGSISPIVDYILKKNIDIPIGTIPAGSGNGLVSSLLHLNDQTFSIDNSISNIIKKKIIEVDLLEVKLLNEKKLMTSFLAVSWGIISDLDICTEWLRNLGELRFTLGGIWFALRKFSYFGTLKYLVDLGNDEYKWVTIKGEFLLFLASNLSHISNEVFIAPDAKVNDGLIHITFMLEPKSRIDILKMLLDLNTGNYINHLNSIKTKHFKLMPEDGIITVDGNEINLQPIEVQVDESKLKIIN